MIRRLLLASAVAVVAVWFLLAPRRPAATPGSDASPAAGVPAAGGVPASAPGRRPVDGASPVADAAGLPPRPASLRGTHVDGALTLGADGRFHASREVRLYFDYWLSAAGEEPFETTRARIVAGIRRRLPAGAADDAVALFERYVRYRDRVSTLRVDDADGTDALAARLDAVHAVRVDVFGADDAAALFGDVEQRDRAALARRRALTDPTLTPEARTAALAAADAELPPEERAARDAAMVAVELSAAEAELRRRGGDDAAVTALRETMVGPEAAQRLAALDRERAAWDARLAAYRAARAAVDGDGSLSAEERTRRVDALRAEHFSGPEQTRVAALDRIAGLDH